MKLNLGCGNTKLPGYVNIDVEASNKPDEIWSIKHTFPYVEKSIDEILLLHTIEHIEKRYHRSILSECHRVLIDSGVLYIAYPEFITCAQYYIENKRGQREFWEATIYGRQIDKSDYHVSLMNTPDFVILLKEVGFEELTIKIEKPPNEINTIIKAIRGKPMLKRDELIRKALFA